MGNRREGGVKVKKKAAEPMCLKLTALSQKSTAKRLKGKKQKGKSPKPKAPNPKGWVSRIQDTGTLSPPNKSPKATNFKKLSNKIFV